MTHREALEVLAAVRGDRVVVPTMGSVAHWPRLSDTPRDFFYQPSSMGQAVPLALGLALAKPGLGVVVVTGDGGLLMNLGCLVTLAQHPVPVTVVLIDNGLYEVTGGQPVPGAGTTDFAGLAASSGIRQVAAFETLPDWRAGATACLATAGPSFVWLKVRGETGLPTPRSPRTMADLIARLRTALGN